MREEGSVVEYTAQAVADICSMGKQICYSCLTQAEEAHIAAWAAAASGCRWWTQTLASMPFQR